MTEKQCNTCKKLLSIEDFHRDSSKKTGHSNKCKDCHKEYCRKHPRKYDAKAKLRTDKWRQNNLDSKETMNKIVKKHRTKKRDWLTKLKSTLCCSVCGYDKPYGLDFHHIYDDKLGSIGNLINHMSLDNVKIELQKCVCLCKNHHSEVHFGNLRCPMTPITVQQLISVNLID